MSTPDFALVMPTQTVVVAYTYSGTEPLYESETVRWIASRHDVESVSQVFAGGLRFNNHLPDDDARNGVLEIGPLPFPPKVFQRFLGSPFHHRVFVDPDTTHTSGVPDRFDRGDKSNIEDWRQGYLLAHLYMCDNYRAFAVDAYKHRIGTIQRRITPARYFEVVDDVWSSGVAEDQMLDLKEVILQAVERHHVWLISNPDFFAILKRNPAFERAVHLHLQPLGFLEDFLQEDII